jgi:hypothetical protein
VTDTHGAVLLTEQLGLAFDDVSTSLDRLSEQSSDLWALGKLHAYREQDAPFLHIDSDVYLWDAPPAAMHAARVFATYPECLPYGQSVYRCASLRAQLRRFGGWLPDELDAYVPSGGVLRAENCGVVGGTHVDFLRFYAGQAIRMIQHPANQAVWARRESFMQDMVIFEQHMLSACIDYHRGRRDSLFWDIDIRYMFPTFDAAMAQSAKVGFTHLIAQAKHRPESLRRLRARVRRDYPRLYERCLAITEEQRV